MWWPGHIQAGATFGEMMSHIDCWSTLASMAGITPPPTGEMKDNNGKPIYFDSVDNSAPTSWANRRIPRAALGSSSTANTSTPSASTSPVIPMSRG
jgi:arylsulfatase A-like enzyme